jgi:hypothetical protein
LAIYGVVMDQGVSMAALGANTLTTGYKQDQFLYSCSAIMLVNPAAGSAGLYHFPAGDIYGDADSITVIRNMIADVAPTEAMVYFGTYDLRNPLGDRDQPVDAGQLTSLTQWLAGQLRFQVRQAPASQGSAAVSIVGGAAQYAHGTAVDVTDLEAYPGGNYPATGYKIYWKAPKPEIGPILVRAKTPDQTVRPVLRRGNTV